MVTSMAHDDRVAYDAQIIAPSVVRCAQGSVGGVCGVRGVGGVTYNVESVGGFVTTMQANLRFSPDAKDGIAIVTNAAG